MAIPKEPHRCSFFLRIHRVLSLLHSELLARSTTPPKPDQESHTVGLDRSSDNSVRNTEETHVFQTSANPTPIRQTIRSTYRHISIWRGRHTLTRGRYQPPKTFEATPPPHRLLLSNVHPNGKELRHLRTRTSSGPESPTKLETAPCMDTTTVHPHHGPRQPHVLETPSEGEQTSRPLVRG